MLLLKFRLRPLRHFPKTMTKQLTLLGQGSLYKAKPYGQKYWATPPNHWLQLFQAHYHRCIKSSPWPL